MGEIAVRLQYDGHSASLGVGPQFVQPVRNATDRHIMCLTLNPFVAEDTDTRALHLACEIYEALRFVQLLAALGRVRHVQVRRCAQVRNPQTLSCKVGKARLDTPGAELRALREVHLALQAPQFDRCKSPLSSMVEDCLPIPFGASERGKTYGIAFRSRSCLEDSGRSQHTPNRLH